MIFKTLRIPGFEPGCTSKLLTLPFGQIHINVITVIYYFDVGIEPTNSRLKLDIIPFN